MTRQGQIIMQQSAPNPIPSNNHRVITMRDFNTKRYGRAGNQFLQYMFLKTYSQQYNCQLQLPSWVGNQLFDTSDPPITCQLLPYREVTDLTNKRQGQPPDGDALVGHDFAGYAQYHTSQLRKNVSHVDNIRRLFEPVSQLKARLEPARDKLFSSGGTVIGLHIRRGDYGRWHFWLTPIAWFLEWLKDHWWLYSTHKSRPKLFIATEDPAVVPYFSEYSPETVNSLGVALNPEPMTGYNYLPYDLRTRQLEQLDWYPDFYLLSQCHVIVASNSTFSFTAAMLDTRLQELWRASLPAAGFEITDPWDDYPLLRDNARDFNHLEGITMRSNHYWC